MSAFQAFVVNKTETEFTAGVQTMSMDDLPEGDVVVRVHYSSVNYKDGLARSGRQNCENVSVCARN